MQHSLVVVNVPTRIAASAEKRKQNLMRLVVEGSSTYPVVYLALAAAVAFIVSLSTTVVGGHVCAAGIASERPTNREVCAKCAADSCIQSMVKRVSCRLVRARTHTAVAATFNGYPPYTVYPALRC